MLTACKDFSKVPAARLLHFKYLGPTDHKGSRVKITDKWSDQSVTLPKSYGYQSIAHQVFDYLTENGFLIAAVSEFSGVVVLARSPNNVHPELRGAS